MNSYLTKFANHTAYQAAESNLLKPNVSYCVQENEVHYNPYVHDYSQDYLTFVALEDGTFKLDRNAVSYSLDNGETWTSLTAHTASPNVSAGNKIMWKGIITPENHYGIGTFSATGNFNVQGNAMSLLFGDNFKGQTNLTGRDYAFSNLFNNNNKVINVDKLSLPATTLTRECYYGMFNGCTNLITTTVLPATTLTQSCYSNMFRGCTSLTTAPELPAATLANNCYYYMFKGCTNLNYIKAMFTTTPSNTYTNNWVSGVSSTGTFVKNSAAQWDVTGDSGVPTGWTVETASE